MNVGMRRASLLPFAVALALVAGCSEPAPPPAPGDADTIYFGGNIITIDDAQPSAEAVAVNDGRIVAVGARADVEKERKGAGTQMLDLAGKTMVPGFVDAHSHFSMVGIQAISANLLPPPDGPATSIAQIQQILRDFMATSPTVEEYGVVVGFDYDDSQLAERRHPTRQELDAVSTDVPIVVIHQSGHLGVYNSKALALAGVTAATPDPEGGVIHREADGKTPNGVLAENAHIAAVMKTLPKFNEQQMLEMIAAAQKVYIANGYTTAQDGRTDPRTLAVLAAAGSSGTLTVDVVAYPDMQMNEKNALLTGPLMSRAYTHHFRIGGVKLGFDGSPQGKTAWFTQPYFEVPSGAAADYAGFPIFASDAEPERLMELAFRNNWQVLVHANGDAAIDQLIRVVGAAEAAVPGTDRRTVLVHGQYLRADQIPQLQALGIFPALFPMHTFYWGDWHRTSVAGPQRAEFISPTAAVLAAGMLFSIHHDAPVTFPNSMRVLDSAVNRTTRTGYVLGPQQRIDPLVALKAMTLWPAFQHFEESTKGSIEVGKNADLVILSENPLTVERAGLKDIEVVETIKNGGSIYRRAS
jgi:predicted amidohydrolase YtcJ